MVLIQGESFQRANQKPYIPSPVDDNGGAWRAFSFTRSPVLLISCILSEYIAMSFAKYIVPALAVAQGAIAASCGDTTISSQSDADTLAADCTTVKGDVTISSSYSQGLDLGSIEKITGTLSCSDAPNITSITAGSLASIGGNFTLDGLTTLSSLSMAELTTIGSIAWQALPALYSLDFTTGVTTVGDLNILNTALTTLDGISLDTVGQFQIEDNTGLKTCNISSLKNATGLISFAGNLDTLEVDLSSLEGGTSMTFRNISSINIPSLETLSGQLGFWGTDFATFSAPQAHLLRAPVLKTVDGGFTVTRNDELQVIDLPDLETVAGAIDFTGNFYEVEFGSLERVAGAFYLESSNGTFSCTKLKAALKTTDIVKGNWKCDATGYNTTTSSDSGSSTSSSSSSSSTSSGAAIANSVAAPVAGAAALFYALAQLI
ncbi:Leucine rich repeat 5 [Penicillium frequentans]|uniref:Leucine rich repeat 5 n=1 Tax=Penicillium frequentans TaxID=3151616 RepID=A0AAD6D875_9EURO|nr:Leucine rich repeat 5 [Penicillium glabrum]